MNKLLSSLSLLVAAGALSTLAGCELYFGDHGNNNNDSGSAANVAADVYCSAGFAACLESSNNASAYFFRAAKVVSSPGRAGEYSSDAMNSRLPVRGGTSRQRAFAAANCRLSSLYLTCRLAASGAA